MKKSDGRLIAVLGMHRSGTSVITRGLKVLGIELGDRLMPPFEGNNAKGFWEDLDINQLNLEMLHVLKSDWHFLASIGPSEVEVLCKSGFLQRAIELLREKTSGAGIFGFKDPRVAKLLPFWKEVFAHGPWKVSYVLVIRHPLSVCHSLAKRDRLEFEKSYLLWLEHVIGSLSGTEGENRVFVDYDHFMQMPEADLAKIAKELQLSIDPHELQTFQREFLDHQLQHTLYDLNDLYLDDKCPPLVQEVYSSLLGPATDSAASEHPSLKPKVEEWDREFSRIRSVLVFADTLGIKLAFTTAERDALNAERKKLLHERAEIQQNLQTTEQTVQRLKIELQDIHQSRAWRWTKPLRKLLSLFQPPK
jgi:hypothetical protein